MATRQVPKRRILLVMYGVTVARSIGSTSQPWSTRPLTTFVMSWAVWKIRQDVLRHPVVGPQTAAGSGSACAFVATASPRAAR